MNWDDMRIFLSVAREESLTGAAKSLRLDPATVGRRIARLEQEMNAVLFVKSPQGYLVSDAGERLLGHAEAAEQAMTGATQEVRGEIGGMSGTIRVGAPDGCATFLLPHVTRKIQAQNPGLEVQIVALPRVFNLSKREADMAISVSRPSAGRIRIQKIADYHLYLAASKSYLADHAPIRTPDDLKTHPVVGYIPDMIFDKELDYLGETGAERVALASNSVSVQAHCIQQGGGIGIVHDFALPFFRRLDKVLPDEISLTRSFYLVRHQDDRRLDRMNRFATALCDGIRAEVARLEAGA